MTGPNEYAQATWLMSPNYDLVSVIVLGTGKLCIACIMNLEGVTPEGVIWNWFMPGFRDCPLFEVNVGSRARHGQEYPVFVECHLRKIFQEPAFKFANVIFCCGKRRVLEAIWQLILTLIKFGVWGIFM